MEQVTSDDVKRNGSYSHTMVFDQETWKCLALTVKPVTSNQMYIHIMKRSSI